MSVTERGPSAETTTLASEAAAGQSAIPRPQRRYLPTPWLPATLVASHLETRDARTLTLDVPGWPGHLAGQHLDVRLTAPNGYRAQRSYSVASAPQANRLSLTVQAVSGGEVSSYLVRSMETGDQIEVRGPLGGWFSWTPQDPNPILLVGGGAGIVPLMSILRERLRHPAGPQVAALFSVRTPDHLFYASELHDIQQQRSDFSIDYIYTRSAPIDAPRPVGRICHQDLPAAPSAAPSPTRAYVCGPTAFVETAARLLTERGYHARDIRTERFGPSGE